MILTYSSCIRQSYYEMGPYISLFFELIALRSSLIMSNHSKTIKNNYFKSISDHFNIMSDHYNTKNVC